MAVPYTFGSATSSIPLSQLDSNFATGITLGNTTVYLGNTTTSFGNVTLTNVTISSVAAAITPSQGGTGLVTIPANNVMLGNGTANVTVVAPGTTGNVLTSNGTTWASTALSAASVPAAGSTTQVQYNNAGAFAGSANLTFNGTTLTAAGLSGPHNGTVGATTPSTGAFTTLSASSTVSGTGFSTYLASPPAIGGTAAAAGTFTTITGSNDASINGLTVGRGAGAVATNTAVGYQSLNSGGGGQDTAVGYQAGYSANISSAYATYIGYRAGYLTTTGIQNVAVGTEALRSNTTASNNTAVGYQAGYSNQTGAGATYIGYQAGYSTTSTSNTFIGFQSGYNVTSAIQNVFVGYWAGLNTTGSANTFVGAGTSAAAGYSVTTGAKNTILGGYTGNQNGLDIRTSNSYVVISDGDGNRVLSSYALGTTALGNSAVPQTGTGITFPATQSASSDANTLDDYEEGTWTPTVIFSSGSTTYTTQTGTYTKIGRLVTVQLNLVAGTVTSPTGSFEFSGLPFTVAATIKGSTSAPQPDTWSVTLTGTLVGSATPSSTRIRMYEYAAGTLANPATKFTSGCGTQLTLTYEV
jgi:hypothetical protein